MISTVLTPTHVVANTILEMEVVATEQMEAIMDEVKGKETTMNGMKFDAVVTARRIQPTRNHQVVVAEVATQMAETTVTPTAAMHRMPTMHRISSNQSNRRSPLRHHVSGKRLTKSNSRHSPRGPPGLKDGSTMPLRQSPMRPSTRI